MRTFAAAFPPSTTSTCSHAATASSSLPPWKSADARARSSAGVSSGLARTLSTHERIFGPSGASGVSSRKCS